MDDGDQAFEALKQGLMADYSDHGIATLQYVEDDANVALIDSDMDDPGQQILVEYSSAIADLVAAEQQLLTSDTHGFLIKIEPFAQVTNHWGISLLVQMIIIVEGF